ncbi:hypothetical protein [Paenibacillus aestuarii]|uniref:Uncharacterized protein n=1 Tax=Paenibacillus aestuarii TaxID=516965 RepID=A0ABW0KI93_9BACL|nr:hypothetical protein [Paenibacillus aestuarii]
MSKKSLHTKKKRSSNGQKMDWYYNELDFLEESKNQEGPETNTKSDNEIPDWYKLIEMLLKR